MNRRFLLLCSVLFSFMFLSGQQVDVTSYNIKFISTDEDMWNSGSNFKLPAIDKEYSFSWDKKASVGGIESIIGMDFGMELYGRTAGKVGVGFYMSEISGGRIDSVIYPINIKFSVPKAEFISAGQTIKISSDVTVDATQKPSVETTFPLEGKMGVNMIFKLKTDLNLSICAFDACLKLDPKDIHACVGDIMDFTFDKPILELNTFNSDPRATIPALIDIPCLPDLSFNIPCIGKYSLLGDYNYWPSTEEISFFPVEFGIARTIKSQHPLSNYKRCLEDTTNVPADCISTNDIRKSIKGDQKLANFLVGSFSLPFIDTLYTTNTKKTLYSLGADTALSLEFRPLNLIAAGKFHDGRFEFPIPCTGGNFYASYLLIRPTLNLDVLAKQDFKFDAKVIVSLVLPTKIPYKIATKNGTIIKNGTDSIITYEVGNDLLLDFPCSYEYMDFNPTFKVQNSFTNRTYASLNFDGKLQAIGFGIGMDEITVIPEIEICIPIPFVGDECFTIPALKFGFDASVGPLIDESISGFMPNPDDLNLEIDIFKKTWEIKSFPEIKTPSFRVAPSRLIASVEADTIMCFGEAAGELSVVTQAGTLPYTYKWSNNTTGNTAQNLVSGDYYVKVTDKNGCVALNGATVFEYPALEIETKDLKHPPCFGDENGYIICEIKGGKAPYSYIWSNGSSGASVENVAAGNYTLSVTDQNNCMIIQNYELTQPTELVAYFNNKTDILCNGNNEGSIKLNATGGVPTYDYYWSNGAISQDVDSLVAGLYSVTVVDKNNCRVTLSDTINEPTLLNAKLEVPRPISCYQGQDGELFANITGGVEPYNIVWYNPQFTVNNNSSVLKELNEGLYQIEVRDANQCYQKDTLLLMAPKERFVSVLSETHLSCFSAEDGIFDLAVTGGSAPYRFNWSDGATEQNRTDMAAGQYKVTITDSKNCLTYNNMVLLEPYKIDGSFTMTKVSCEGEYDGVLEFIAKGGTAPYTYNWSDGAETQKAMNLPQGIHSVVITDSKLCEAEFEHELLVDGTKCFDIPNAFSPNGDGYNDTWVIKNITSMYPNHRVEIFTQEGNIMYSSSGGSYVPWDGKRNDNAVPSGTYYFIIDLGNGSELIKGSLTIIR